MIDVSLGFIISSLPWWLAAPVLQLTVLVVGMALDETYVNRTTVLTGAIATHLHIFVAGDAGLLVSVYADLGLVVGAYGLYAYVIDGYVAGWFRFLAYFVYAPLSVFLVILTAGPTLFGVEPLVLPALAVAGYANVQLREYLRPADPYYFGPESQDAFEAVVDAEPAPGDAPETGVPGAEAAAGTDPAAASPESTADAGATGASAAGDPSAATAGDPTAAGSAAQPGPAASGATTSADASAGATPAGSTASPASAADGGTGPTAESQAANAGRAADSGAGVHPDDDPADADSSERGILPKFMRRL